ncbi:autophagy-related protein 18h-like [Aristolochia californica]|uniref:autophagy-related protein 18h-like n=1 Tax=Aristolochia californica TaxID=171875 RepID=UPI0035E02EA4
MDWLGIAVRIWGDPAKLVGRMRKEKGGGGRNGLLPNSLKIISSCLKAVSTNASTLVRSAGASVAASIAVAAEDDKEQVLWAGFDKLEFGPSTSRRVLLLGYSNGFQVVDVEDASNVCELVSKRDGPVTFLQMLPTPEKSKTHQGFSASHPLLLVVAGDETSNPGLVQNPHSNVLVRDGITDSQPGNCGASPTVVRFYSLQSDNYVHLLRFRSTVYLIRCSSRVIAVALASQIYCFDAVTLENKFSVLTYPIPQGGQGMGINIGYGPMAVGPRWLAYASNNPFLPNTGRLSPQNLTPSPGVSPSTSPGSGSLMARYAMESSKQLAAGIINLGDMGYKTLSKYCQELLPDGSSSPVSSNSGCKVGRVTAAAHSVDTEHAGMVVIKDFVTKAIISQFKAHTSPISALCFDPSGTLLVTASVHGNNINVFRIMPSSMQGGNSSLRYDWSSSHVHLYKLYRGLTTAVIQDICFSHYSQWVAIVSSRGTCHIFVLSPFGGDVTFQTQRFQTDGLILSPSLSLPWWSTSSCTISQKSTPPPVPVTLSVVSRIKNSTTGWLNTVSSAAASATGKVPIPSGALAATFHYSFYQNPEQVRFKTNSLEHLLVYSPLGYVVQHELLPSLGLESYDTSSRAGLGPMQDDELRVNAEPVQSWSVCRRSNWPERAAGLSGFSLCRSDTEDVIMDGSDSEYNDINGPRLFSDTAFVKDLAKANERPHWYLSNAEVQISSGRMPIWQKSKISFYMMMPAKVNQRRFSDGYSGGEIEIEKVPVHEVEIKQKDLLPVFEHFQCSLLDWSSRAYFGERCPSYSSSGIDQTKDKFIEESLFRHIESPSCGSVESSGIGTSTATHTSAISDPTRSSVLLGHFVSKIGGEPSVAKSNASNSFLSNREEGSALSGISSSQNDSNHMGTGMTVIKAAFSLDNRLSGEILNMSNSNHSASEVPDDKSGTTELQNPLDFAQYFHEGYCKISELDDCRELPEVVTDADSSSSHCEREKPDEDGDNDDMLGGVFAFSEEG